MPTALALFLLLAATPTWKKSFRAETGLKASPDRKQLSFWIGEKAFLADAGKPARPFFIPPRLDQPEKHDQTGTDGMVPALDGASIDWHVSRLNHPEHDRDDCFRYSELYQTDLAGKNPTRLAVLGREEPSEAVLAGPKGPALLRCACPPRKEDKFALSCRLAALDEATLAGPALVAGRYDWELGREHVALWPSWRGTTFPNAPAPVVWSGAGKSWTVDIGGRKAYRGSNSSRS